MGKWAVTGGVNGLLIKIMVYITKKLQSNRLFKGNANCYNVVFIFITVLC